MKLFRKAFALLMALTLMLSMSLTVLAVDVGSADDFRNAYDQGETDFNLTADIKDRIELEAEENKSYSIGSDGGYTLSEVSVGGSGSVEINTDITGGLEASGSVSVTVNGDVSGKDNAYSYSGDDYSSVSGGEGVFVDLGASVTVNGDVTGGNAEASNGETYVNGGAGAVASSGGEITVNGNVTGGSANGGVEAVGGVAVSVQIDGNVTVTGDATGGNASGGSETNMAAPGALVVVFPDADATTLTVEGTVQAGEGDESMGDLLIDKAPAWDEYDNPTEYDAAIPDITVGACENIVVAGFTEEEEAAVKAAVKIVGLKKDEEQKPGLDSHWGYLLQAIKMSKPGDELTTDAGARKYIPAVVIEAVRDADVKLTVKWTGGDDLVITKDFTEEVSGNILLTDLAEMLKK